VVIAPARSCAVVQPLVSPGGVLGLNRREPPRRRFDLVVVAGGPARAIAAAVTASSEGLLLTLGVTWSRSAVRPGPPRIENYLARLPTGIFRWRTSASVPSFRPISSAPSSAVPQNRCICFRVGWREPCLPPPRRARILLGRGGVHPEPKAKPRNIAAHRDHYRPFSLATNPGVRRGNGGFY